MIPGSGSCGTSMAMETVSASHCMRNVCCDAGFASPNGAETRNGTTLYGPTSTSTVSGPRSSFSLTAQTLPMVFGVPFEFTSARSISGRGAFSFPRQYPLARTSATPIPPSIAIGRPTAASTCHAALPLSPPAIFSINTCSPGSSLRKNGSSPAFTVTPSRIV